MLLNLNDPQSILQWWLVWPERHHAFLEHKLKASPEFGFVIREALKLIQRRPEYRSLRRPVLPVHRELPVAAVHHGTEGGEDFIEERPSYKDRLAA
ncbi:hypothetical protein ACFJGW_08160 [Burkholderiaceae bacterium UC74_6]